MERGDLSLERSRYWYPLCSLSPLLVLMSLGSQIRLRRLWVGMESDHWQVGGVDGGWLPMHWALSSLDFSSSETGIPLYTKPVCFPTLNTSRSHPATFVPLFLHFRKLPHAERWSLSPPFLLTQSFFGDREPPSWLQPNHLPWSRTHSVLLLFQTLRVFRTPHSLSQPLSLILAFWFLEISIKLNSLHARTYCGYECTNSPIKHFPL